MIILIIVVIIIIIIVIIIGIIVIISVAFSLLSYILWLKLTCSDSRQNVNHFNYIGL